MRQVQLCRDGLGQRPRHQGLPRARQRVYNDKHADDEEWLNPSGFTLMDPIVIDLEDVRREIEEELKGTADYGR